MENNRKILKIGIEANCESNFQLPQNFEAKVIPITYLSGDGLEGRFLPQAGNFFAHIYRNWSIDWAVRLDLLVFKPRKSRGILQKYQINSKYILFVGTQQPRKNLIRFIKSLSVGKPGWMYNDILFAPKRYKVTDRVVFLGRVWDYDLPFLYSGAEVFVLPSIVEGFGPPLLEAQACGTPVIVTKNGATREVSGGTAAFVNPYSTRSIREGLLKVIGNYSLKKSLISNGLANAKKYGWDKASCNTRDFLVQVGMQN